MTRQALAALVLVATAGPARALTETCAQTVAVFEAGREVDQVCPDVAAARGLTVVDLSDGWAPMLLRGQPYEATYVALANESPGPGHEFDRARTDRYFELYGIPPNFRLVAGRLLDGARQMCHVVAGGVAIQALTTNLRVGDPTVVMTPEVQAALQQRLICERLLPLSDKPMARWRLELAMLAYQRKQAIVSKGILDGETRRVLATDPRELDFRTLLRVLQARVVDATGLIEDGSALAAHGTVLGRHIDGEAFYRVTGKALPGGAPDLASMATEVAALELGWRDPEAAAEFFRRRGAEATRSLVVALRLPPPPAYHSANMELRAEIDRGDVWYDLPGQGKRPEATPTITLFVKTAAGTELALVRWPTTIGGWKREVGASGGIGLRFKDSDVGPRVWRDLVVTPAWLPPDGTPPRTLVRSVGKGQWIADTDLVGPGYASAYGMVMLIHHKTWTSAPSKAGKPGKTYWSDNGIRTHGTVSYTSILRGESHGCHRLFNQSAVELASFLLRHRPHEARGVIATAYKRILHWQGRSLALPIPNRGTLIELTPPVPVEVLAGAIHGRYQKPPGQMVRLPPKPRPRR